LTGWSLLLLGALCVAWAARGQAKLTYTPRALTTGRDAQLWLDERHADCARDKVWSVASERLVRHGDKTPRTFLYIHGFGACRAEGEGVVDIVANNTSSNTLYLRLPGHGTDAEDHASRGAQEYLDCVTEGLEVAQTLGEQVIVIGTSMGGLLATWLAATYPDDVDALILAAPYYAHRNRYLHTLLNARWGLPLMHRLRGPIRETGGYPERGQPGYDERWLVRQRYAALPELERLRRYIARPDVFRGVTAPTLTLVHDDGLGGRDRTSSIAAIHAALSLMPGVQHHAASRHVAIADGAHVLLSDYVRTDKVTIHHAIERFLDELPQARHGGPHVPS